MRKSTMRDVAVAAGVSEATVSRVFSGQDSVTEHTARKVMDAASELEFSISRSASSLASGKTKRIGVLIPEKIGIWFNAHVLDGIYNGAYLKGYELVPYVIAQESMLEAFFNQLPARGNVDALIVLSFDLSPEHQVQLKKLDMPCIGIDTPSREGFDATVGIDELKTMRSLVKHLKSLGHDSLLYFGGGQSSRFSNSTGVRELAFVQATGEALIDHAPVLYCGEDFVDSLGDLLQLKHRPTAICCESDQLALEALQVLEKLGMKVPEDVSVVGFDNQQVSEIAGLATIEQIPQELGTFACQLAVSLLSGEKLDDAAHHLTFATRLVPRASLGKCLVNK